MTFQNAKFLAGDTVTLISATIRFAVFIPLYRGVVVCERRLIHLPARVIHMALHGQRRARSHMDTVLSFYR